MPHHNTIIMRRSDKSARIANAIIAIKLGEVKDYLEAARRFNIDHTTISKRTRGITYSHGGKLPLPTRKNRS
jgi:hypothetical protein